MIKNTLRYFDYLFYLRFAGVYLFLYYSYIVTVSVSAPTGIYYPFVDNYLNFPVWIRSAVLYSSQFLLSLFSYPTVLSTDSLHSPDGRYILTMAWPCMGIGVMCFWLAFVCSHKMAIKKKVSWCLNGIVTIFLINCARVLIMMIAMVDQWPISEYLGTNAHDLFNYISYAALLILVFTFYAKTGNKAVQPKKNAQKQPVIARSL